MVLLLSRRLVDYPRSSAVHRKKMVPCRTNPRPAGKTWARLLSRMELQVNNPRQAPFNRMARPMGHSITAGRQTGSGKFGLAHLPRIRSTFDSSDLDRVESGRHHDFQHFNVAAMAHFAVPDFRRLVNAGTGFEPHNALALVFEFDPAL